MNEEMYECPDEHHVMENSFNPSTESAYGPMEGCETCDDTGEVTEEVYKLYQEQVLIDKFRRMPKSKF